jgi:prepilin signal peptidase PulO-like enzyme (type II secretory pathway)
MYPFNIHILFYVLFCVLGAISGQISSWCIKRMPEHKKVLSKDFFKEFKIDYKLIIITIIIYMVLLIMYGIKNQFLNNLQLIKYIILTPMLISAFVIDYKYQIIPNRLNLTIFEVGLASSFVAGLYNMNLLTDSLLGMAVRRRSIFNYNFNWRVYRRKRSYGFWRCKIHGRIGAIFWTCKYNYDNTYGIFVCSNY